MLKVTTKVTGSILTKRGVTEVTRVCNRLGALEVRDQFPDHFAPNAQQRFKYKRRTKKYEKRKQRLFGHTTPLVYTGDLERAVLSSAKVTATSKRGTVQARGSRSSNLRQQYKDEVETITKKQDRELSNNWGDNFEELAQLSQYKKKI